MTDQTSAGIRGIPGAGPRWRGCLRRRTGLGEVFPHDAFLSCRRDRRPQDARDDHPGPDRGYLHAGIAREGVVSVYHHACRLCPDEFEFDTAFVPSTICPAAAVRENGGRVVGSAGVPVDLVFMDGGQNLYPPLLMQLQPRLRPGAVLITANVRSLRSGLIWRISTRTAGSRSSPAGSRKKGRAAYFRQPVRPADHILSISRDPNSEHLTCSAPSIWRAKS